MASFSDKGLDEMQRRWGARRSRAAKAEPEARAHLCLANLSKGNGQFVQSAPMPRSKALKLERELTEVGIDVLIVDGEEEQQ